MPIGWTGRMYKFARMLRRVPSAIREPLYDAAPYLFRPKVILRYMLGRQTGLPPQIALYLRDFSLADRINFVTRLDLLDLFHESWDVLNLSEDSEAIACLARKTCHRE